jgi:hypothetical protein
MKSTLIKRASVKLRSAIKNGWEDLCDELDKIYLENESHIDNPLPDAAVLADTKRDSKSPPVRLEGPQYDARKDDEKVEVQRLSDACDGTTTSDEESDNEDLIFPRVSNGEIIAPKRPPRPRGQLPRAAPKVNKKRNHDISVRSNYQTDSEEDVPQHNKQRTQPTRTACPVVEDDTRTPLRNRLRSTRRLPQSLGLEPQDFAEEEEAASSGDDTISIDSIKPVSRRVRKVVADLYTESEDDESTESSDCGVPESSESKEIPEKLAPKKKAAPKKKPASKKKAAPKKKAPLKKKETFAASPTPRTNNSATPPRSSMFDRMRNALLHGEAS